MRLLSILVIAIQPPPLRRPPDAGKRKDGAGVVIGLVVDVDVMTHEGIEVEQAYRDVGAVGLIAGLLGKAAR